ncbi:MAG: gas vesicle protein K [Kofleriaceae bacterium]
MHPDVHEDVPELDLDRRASGDLDELAQAAALLDRIDRAGPRRIDANEENAGKGIAKLVLSLVELVRRLLERQAIRRMDAGTLTDAQIERMGQTFLKLADKLAELRASFGLEAEDLELGVGSIGDLTDGEDHGQRT